MVMLAGIDVSAQDGTGDWLVSELTFTTERRKRSEPSGDITEEYRNILSLTVYTDWDRITGIDTVAGLIATITAVNASFNGSNAINLKASGGTGFPDWRQLRSDLGAISLPGGAKVRQTVNFASVAPWADLDWDQAQVVSEPMRLTARKIDATWDVTQLTHNSETQRKPDTDPNDNQEQYRNVLMLSREQSLTGISTVSNFKTGLYTTPVVRAVLNGGPEINISPGTGYGNFLITEFAITPTGAQGCEQCIVSERHEARTDYADLTWSD